MDLDRSLQHLANGYRPDRQPSLDDLVSRHRARRRTAVLVSAMSVLVVVVGIALAVDRAPAGKQVVVGGTPTATATADGCDLKESGGIIDYVDFVLVGHVSLQEWFGPPAARPVVRDADLGAVVTHVTCRLEDHHNGFQAQEMKDGYASFLEVGTPVYAVSGFDPACRVAARLAGRLHEFYALDPDAHVAKPAACALMPGLDPDGLATRAGDVRGAPVAYRDRMAYRDCGSIDSRALGRPVDAGGEQSRACWLDVLDSHSGDAEVRSVLSTIDAGPVYEVLRVRDGAIELWTSGYNSYTGARDGAEYWHHSTCTGIDRDHFSATGCVVTD